MTSDPDEIRSNIERAQQNLSADVDALAQKVSPPRIVERQVQRTRSTMTSLKDRIMGSAGEQASAMGAGMSSSASSARDTVMENASSARDTVMENASSARDAVIEKTSSAADAASSVPQVARQRTRGNPLVAGLVAFGAGWLLSSLLPATEPEQQVASQVKDLATEKGRPVAEQLSQAGQQLRESAQQRAEAVRETAASAASTVTDEAQSRASDVAGHAQQAATRVSEQARPVGS
jgi:cell division septum initiation protein DivIVA